MVGSSHVKANKSCKDALKMANTSTYEMKAHVFRVVPNGTTEKFSDVLLKIYDRGVADRLRTVSNGSYRMEQLKISDKHIDENGNSTLFIFSLMGFRTGHGPGKASPEALIDDIDYDGGAPSEDVVALYDVNSSCIVIQYAHNGPRSKAILNYVNSWVSSGCYTFNSILDADFENRFSRQKNITRVDLKVDVSDVSEQERNSNIAFGHALSAAEELGGTTLDITISVDGRGGNTLSGNPKGFLQDLIKVNKHDREPVKKLESKGAVDDVSQEIVNLLGGKLTGVRSVPISDSSYRMSLDDRSEAILSIFHAWNNNGALL